MTYDNPDPETLVECVPTMAPFDIEIRMISICGEGAQLECDAPNYPLFHRVPVHTDFARLINVGDTIRITVEHIPTDETTEDTPS